MIYLEKPDQFSPRFTIVSCFVDHDGEFLLLHRQDHKPQGNTWGVPAGKVEKEEDKTEAMVREMREEIAVDAHPDNLRHFKELYVRYDDYDFIYHIYHYPLPHKPDLTINPAEHKAHTWVKPEEALTMNLIQDEDACISRFYFTENSK